MLDDTALKEPASIIITVMLQSRNPDNDLPRTPIMLRIHLNDGKGASKRSGDFFRFTPLSEKTEHERHFIRTGCDCYPCCVFRRHNVHLHKLTSLGKGGSKPPYTQRCDSGIPPKNQTMLT